MSDLPNWIYDVVMALQKWENEHPVLFMDHFRDGYVKVEDCGCSALQFVPEQVKAQARAIAAYTWKPEVSDDRP